ncbi:unnamed protein product [Amoebophrya sp. A120]|nr:unnamed protein product [Amoebophrya sp. A120]|eukprot:GSA120T00015624001.1
MSMAETKMTEGYDPRGNFCRGCFTPSAIWAWQGCDEVFPVLCSTLLCLVFPPAASLFGIYFWQPVKVQKKWSAEPAGEKWLCCCNCHPHDPCCKFWFPFTVIYAWQGLDDLADTLISLVDPPVSMCYALWCWIPRSKTQQKIWGSTRLSSVGAPVMAAALYNSSAGGARGEKAERKGSSDEDQSMIKSNLSSKDRGGESTTSDDQDSSTTKKKQNKSNKSKKSSKDDKEEDVTASGVNKSKSKKDKDKDKDKNKSQNKSQKKKKDKKDGKTSGTSSESGDD